MKHATPYNVKREDALLAKKGSADHATAMFDGKPSAAGHAGKVDRVSGMPRSGVIRETLMPDGSTLVTVAPEARRAASARAARIITEIRAKARRD